MLRNFFQFLLGPRLILEQNKSIIRGRYFHWSAIVIVYCLPYCCLYYIHSQIGGFLSVILNVLLLPTITIFLLPLFFNFKLEIDKQNTKLYYRFLFITYSKIEVFTKNLYIRDTRISDLDYINRDDELPHSKKLYLDYNYPYDSDKLVIYIEFNNKEEELLGFFEDDIWENIIKGLNHLDLK